MGAFLHKIAMTILKICYKYFMIYLDFEVITMSKKSSFAKKFPPLFILSIIISFLVIAYKIIFANRNPQTDDNKRTMRTIYADPKPMLTTDVPQIEHKSS